MVHFPVHGNEAHCAGGGVGVAAPGTQPHAPFASKSQCPSKSGHRAPGGQRWITHGPMQAAESHSLGNVGAGVGVGRFTGTQSHVPAELI